MSGDIDRSSDAAGARLEQTPAACMLDTTDPQLRWTVLASMLPLQGSSARWKQKKIVLAATCCDLLQSLLHASSGPGRGREGQLELTTCRIFQFVRGCRLAAKHTSY